MNRVRRLLWAAVAFAALASYAGYQLSAREQGTRGEFGHVPAFSLKDQRGRTVTDQNLLGTVWVANFVYTRCASVCPMLTAKFKALQNELRSLRGVRYLSISVDPEHDTPEVLSAYAARFGADAERWLFLTGPLAEIEKTVVKGFKIHMGKPTPSPNDPSLVDIMHGEHFVLIDRNGVIRGYYRSDHDGVAQLAADLKQLAN